MVSRCFAQEMLLLIPDDTSSVFRRYTSTDVLEIFGALLEECDALRKASAHIIQLKQNINQPLGKRKPK